MVVATAAKLEHKRNSMGQSSVNKQSGLETGSTALSRDVSSTTDALQAYIESHKDVSPDLREHTEAMAKIVGTLSAKINAVEDSSDRDYVIPDAKNPLLSPAFLIPAMLLAGLITVTVWLFSLAGILKADTVYIVTVVVGLLLVLQVLFSNIRNFQLHHKIAKQSQLAVEEELKLERARAELFSSATEELQSHLFAITGEMPPGTNKSIDDASNRLMALLDRMSLISNLTRRGADYVLNTQEIELSSQLARIIASSKGDYPKAEVDVELHAPNTKAELDPLLFEQAVRPIIDNAIKFSQQAAGGGKVSVVLVPHKSGFELKVSDNGPGIAPERRSQLFKPFSRGEDALRFNYEGAGLGLYLASLSAGLLGGSLEIAKSKTGSEFVLKFESVQKPEEPQKSKAQPTVSRAKTAHSV